LKKKPNQQKAPTLSFVGVRLKPDVEELLRLAEEATGASRSTLVIESLMLFLPTVLDTMAGKRATSALKFQTAMRRRLIKNMGTPDGVPEQAKP